MQRLNALRVCVEFVACLHLMCDIFTLFLSHFCRPDSRTQHHHAGGGMDEEVPGAQGGGQRRGLAGARVFCAVATRARVSALLCLSPARSLSACKPTRVGSPVPASQTPSVRRRVCNGARAQWRLARVCASVPVFWCRLLSAIAAVVFRCGVAVHSQNTFRRDLLLLTARAQRRALRLNAHTFCGLSSSPPGLPAAVLCTRARRPRARSFGHPFSPVSDRQPAPKAKWTRLPRLHLRRRGRSTPSAPSSCSSNNSRRVAR
jgi:hypothetical protein